MINICEMCGKEFEALKSTKKCCSTECYNARRRKQYAQRERFPKNIAYKGKEKVCPICNESFYPKTSMANQRICCYNCMPDGVQLTRGKFLEKIKMARGGKCIRCGYNKCIKALEFHHLDPTQKDFTISNDHFKLMEAVNESKKCILICSNCHRELHENIWNIEEIYKEKEEVNLELNFD